MGTYRVAQICLNWHVATSSADQHPQLMERFCSTCGEATIMHCPHCSTSIRGNYDVPDIVFVGSFYDRPRYCYNCGKPFPWTERSIASAMGLVEEGGDLSAQELQQLHVDLLELTKDSPKIQVASLRFKKAMGKLGGSVASGVKDIIVDVLSEAAKKVIFGQ